jgi:hypothetical protein
VTLRHLRADLPVLGRLLFVRQGSVLRRFRSRARIEHCLALDFSQRLALQSVNLLFRGKILNRGLGQARIRALDLLFESRDFDLVRLLVDKQLAQPSLHFFDALRLILEVGPRFQRSEQVVEALRDVIPFFPEVVGETGDIVKQQ